jgi:hypothetical protein
MFSAPLPSHIVSSYGALRGVFDAFRGMRRGDYDFLNKPPPLGVDDVTHTSNNSARIEPDLEALVIDLEILDATGRVAIEALADIHGGDLPNLPPWSRMETAPLPSP